MEHPAGLLEHLLKAGLVSALGGAGGGAFPSSQASARAFGCGPATTVQRQTRAKNGKHARTRTRQQKSESPALSRAIFKPVQHLITTKYNVLGQHWARPFTQVKLSKDKGDHSTSICSSRGPDTSVNPSTLSGLAKGCWFTDSLYHQ